MMGSKGPCLTIHSDFGSRSVPKTVVMQVGSWKARPVFVRYGIVSAQDIGNAIAKV